MVERLLRGKAPCSRRLDGSLSKQGPAWRSRTNPRDAAATSVAHRAASIPEPSPLSTKEYCPQQSRLAKNESQPGQPAETDRESDLEHPTPTPDVGCHRTAEKGGQENRPQDGRLR